MVCLGNICRSPMAQGAMEYIAEQNGLHIKVDSAGTSGYHKGEAPDERAVACMQKHGIDISAQKSRQLTSEDFYFFDVIFVMDRSNYKDVISLCPDEKLKNKIRLYREFDPVERKKIVPDPYYGGLHEFDNVFDLVIDAAHFHVKNWIED